MTGWLADTVVLSELRKPRCDANVAAWARAQPAESIFVSDVSIAEIDFGIERVAEAAFREQLATWREGLLGWLADRVLPVDRAVILEWRRLVEFGRRANRTFSQPDLFISATALHHRLIVVTRNVGDLGVLGRVPVLDPWNATLRFAGESVAFDVSRTAASALEAIAARAPEAATPHGAPHAS